MSEKSILPAVLAHLDDAKRPAERDWFGDAIELFKSPSEDDRMQAAAEAVGIWKGYALFCESIECLDDTTAGEKRKLRNDLDHAHYEATWFLRMEAELAGLNCAALAVARRVCQEIFKPIRGDGPVLSPYPVEWFHHPKCICDTWPYCLGEWRYSLPPAMQDAIGQGELAFEQLVVRLSITPPINPPVNPHIKQGRQIEAAEPARDELSDDTGAPTLVLMAVPTRCRNEERDAWVAKQRAKKTPLSWAEIFDDGLRMSARRGWDMPGSPDSLSEAYRKYMSRQRRSPPSRDPKSHVIPRRGMTWGGMGRQPIRHLGRSPSSRRGGLPDGKTNERLNRIDSKPDRGSGADLCCLDGSPVAPRPVESRGAKGSASETTIEKGGGRCQLTLPSERPTSPPWSRP